MQIVVAKNIGFCSGVRRAVDIVENLLSQSKDDIYSLGPIIHNPLVIQHLAAKNLKVVHSLENIQPHSYLILPSHGAERQILDLAKKKKLRTIDVTCPYVASVQKICQWLYQEKYQVIIVGDKEHPEIKALLSLAPGAQVVSRAQEINQIKVGSKIGIISQTTQAKERFFKVVCTLLKSNIAAKELRIFNTICRDTLKRQEEVKELARKAEAVLVIGSKFSANTKRLYHISQKINKSTFLIQTTRELKKRIIGGRKSIAIISGASAPDWLVRKIIKTIRKGGTKK